MSKLVGILDPSGSHPNPFTGSPYTDDYKSLAKNWSSLLTYSKATEILTAIKDNNVILVSSGTGSGKSVLVPKFVLHHFNYKKKIVMTLPKRVITKAAAEYAAKTLDVKLGTYVGYKYRGAPKHSMSDSTKLLFATDGTVVAKLLKDEALDEFNAVIIDEAHERKIQIDFLLYLLKNTLRLRKDFKLVIMSATIDETIFKTYFKKFNFCSINIQTSPNFPVESIFTKSPIKDYVDNIHKLVVDIVKSGKHGDILAFVPSIKETKTICRLVANDPSLKDVYCVEFYSGQDNKIHELVEKKEKYKEIDKKYKRKLVVATDIAESSLTIEGIIFVIDSGKSIQASYNPTSRAKVIERLPVTKSQITQRIGRAGRIEAGTCYHLYTKDEFEKLPLYPDPLIIKSNIIDECLKLIAVPSMLTIKKLTDTFYKFIEPPGSSFVNNAISTLRSLKLLDREKILQIGLIIANARSDVYMATALAYAAVYNCSWGVSKLCAMYNALDGLIPNLFYDNDEQHKTKLKTKFASKRGDLISLLKIYKFLHNKRNDKNFPKWCMSQGFNYNSVKKMMSPHFNSNIVADRKYFKAKRNEMKELLEINKDILKLSKFDRILCCFYNGYILNIGKQKRNNMYVICNIAGTCETVVKINRESFLNLIEKKPSQIFYLEYAVVLGSSMLNFVSRLPKIMHLRKSLA